MSKNRIIKLSESDLYRIVKRVLSEQNEPKILTDQQAVRQLEMDVNNIISKRQNEIFSKLEIKWKSGGDGQPIIFSVFFDGVDTGGELKLLPSEDGREWGTEVSYINLGKVSIKDYLGDVFKNPDYKILFERHPNVKNQVENATANSFLRPQNRSFGDINISGGLAKGKGDYSIDDLIPFGSKLTTMGTGTNIFNVNVGKKIFFSFDIGNSQLYLDQFRISYTGDLLAKNKTESGDTRVIDVTLVNAKAEPFVFDNITLTPESSSEIEKFVNKINEVKNVYGEKVYKDYVNFLKKQPIEVLAYSSVDADPNEKVPGNYKPCKGYGDKTRGQYNLCLSQARADKIANILNEKLPEIGSFVGKGMGETTKFGPGWTKEKPTNTDETLPNRRFMVSLPKYTINIKM